MNVFRSTLALAATTAFLLIACDSPSEPADDVDASNVCDQDLCATSNALSDQCDDVLSTCLEVEAEANADECVAAALLICRGT